MPDSPVGIRYRGQNLSSGGTLIVWHCCDGLSNSSRLGFPTFFKTLLQSILFLISRYRRAKANFFTKEKQMCGDWVKNQAWKVEFPVLESSCQFVWKLLGQCRKVRPVSVRVPGMQKLVHFPGMVRRFFCYRFADVIVAEKKPAFVIVFWARNSKRVQCNKLRAKFKLTPLVTNHHIVYIYATYTYFIWFIIGS